MEEPNIITIKERKLVGMKIRTSLSENKTFELWSRFKPQVKEIPHRKTNEFFSVEIFDEDLEFNQFTPQTFFEKWAAVEVKSFEDIPREFETLLLPAGKYAIFIHKGLLEDFAKTSRYIFGEWLPNSPYQLDTRPHFEVMDDNYDPKNPEAEEEVWVPVQ